MKPVELINEGRRLQRRTVLLSPEGGGEAPAACWYGARPRDNDRERFHCWMSFDASLVPDGGLSGVLSLFTDREGEEPGYINRSNSRLPVDGLPLYAREVEVLPPIDVVFLRGSERVGTWLDRMGWERSAGWNDNFPDSATADAYIEVQQSESPLYLEGSYATLGGWHHPWPDDDWLEFVDDQLLAHTFMDAEPYLEAWLLRSGAFKLMERIT